MSSDNPYAALPTLVRIVPFEPFSALSGKACLPWHDRWSQTRVVPSRRRGAT